MNGINTFMFFVFLTFGKFVAKNVNFVKRQISFGSAKSGLTKKAEPPPTRGFRKTKAAGDGGWLRRLVRRLVFCHKLSPSTSQDAAISAMTRKCSE